MKFILESGVEVSDTELKVGDVLYGTPSGNPVIRSITDGKLRDGSEATIIKITHGEESECGYFLEALKGNLERADSSIDIFFNQEGDRKYILYYEVGLPDVIPSDPEVISGELKIEDCAVIWSSHTVGAKERPMATHRVKNQ